jgi:hypothetical protein
VTADYALYLGNAYSARALDPSKDPNASLQADVAALAEAERVYVRGLHGNDPARPVAFLDPFFAQEVAKLPREALAGQQPCLLTGDPINADPPPAHRTAGEHIQRVLRAVDASLFVALERADRLRRTQDHRGAASALRTAALRTWIDVATLAPVLSLPGAPWANDVTAFQSQLEDAGHRYLDILQDRNLFGYAPGYVPFLWNKDVSGTNYMQIRANADEKYRTWDTLHEQVMESGRLYEQSASALAREIGNQTALLDDQLDEICGAGATTLDRCGSDFGEENASLVAQQILELQAANDRVQHVLTQMSNVREAIKIEEDRAAQVAKVHENRAILVRQTGERIAADEIAIRRIQRDLQMTHSMLGGFLSFNPLGFFASMAFGLQDYDISEMAEKYEQDKAEQLIIQQESVEYSAMQIELIDSAAKVKTALLELATLDLDLDLALLNAMQACGRLRAHHDKASRLLAEKARVSAVATGSARQLIHYRIYADATARRAAEASRRALEWGYLAGRALEYQLVEEFTDWSRLWTARAPPDLLLYLSGLQDRAGKARTAQGSVDVISLRDDVLGMGALVLDLATGEMVSPRDQFRRFVADPAHRDADGNLHVSFSTSDDLDPLFSSSVCSDRIRQIKVNLVGDMLGAAIASAYVKLVHGGTSHLRACTRAADGSVPLVDYDVSGKGNKPGIAHVQASINAARTSLTDPNAPNGNVELQERAVLAGPWELVIDQTAAEPMNANLNVLGLDDIEIVFVHDAYTIQ